MALCRIILAGLVALAVTLAPVGAALAAAHSPTKATMQDCHGKAAKHCPDCESTGKKAKCPGDGSQCCKLIGTVGASPKLIAVAPAAQQFIDPSQPPGWVLRPQPPPPRS